MPDAGRLRDSTQILLPPGALEGIQDELESRFVVSVIHKEDVVQIIGSPVEIKDASDFLTRNGIPIS